MIDSTRGEMRFRTDPVIPPVNDNLIAKAEREQDKELSSTGYWLVGLVAILVSIAREDMLIAAYTRPPKAP